ncbi:pyrimidine 5-nucleotidase [Xylariaceae sp. AK1471]|nr:pyrimidine 5-nucleotidase [Xylariaceae sp. AK1471]
MKSVESVANGLASPKKVMFFDIDNCLYPKSANVHDRMADLIHAYIEKCLNIPPEEAVRLHKEYYTNYGLAITGLVRHHQIDPLEFNAEVDDRLPLDDLIKPRPELHHMLRDIDRSQVKIWLFTNAYVTHARRVARILEIDDMFDGLTFCDYSTVPFLCKPQEDMYAKAMMEAGVESFEDCYFVDDSYNNCAKAQQLGWNTVHLVEEGVTVPEKQACKYQIKYLEELRVTFPQLFKAA